MLQEHGSNHPEVPQVLLPVQEKKIKTYLWGGYHAYMHAHTDTHV